MAESASLRAFVYGKVQGTYFRAYVSRKAAELGVTGYVRNRSDGSVEVEAEGQRSRLETLIAYLNIGSPASRVDKVITSWSESTGQYADFEIRY